MATKYQQLESLLIDIQSKVDSLIGDIRIIGNQIQITEGLSDISEKLGLIRAGEFRSGNEVDPGSGFTGMRTAFPPMTYEGEEWNLVGINNDNLQFGVRASDGTLMAGDGSVVLGNLVSTIAGWTITASEIKKNGIILDSTGDVIYVGSGIPRIVIDGGNKLINSSNYVANLTGFQISGETGDAEFNNITARGDLRSTIISSGGVQATSGTMGVYKSAGLLENDLTTVASPTTFEMDIQDPESGHVQVFEVNDIIKVGNNWVTVSSIVDQVTYYRYVCTLSSGTATTHKRGAICLDYGVAGQGYLTMSADQTNAPFYSVRTHAGAPWSASNEVIRIGNMNGFMGNTTDVYGLGMTAGELRLGTGTVGTDFSGVRLGTPAFTYPEGTFNFAGTSSDVLQFGLRASDGAAIFFGGRGRITENGIELFGANYGITQTANQGESTERTGRLGMFYTGSNSDPAAYGMEYHEGVPISSTTNLISNGSFESDPPGFTTPTDWILVNDTGVWA